MDSNQLRFMIACGLPSIKVLLLGFRSIRLKCVFSKTSFFEWTKQYSEENDPLFAFLLLQLSKTLFLRAMTQTSLLVSNLPGPVEQVMLGNNPIVHMFPVVAGIPQVSILF